MRNALGLVAWLVVSFAPAWIGTRFRPGDWYASLAKPAWNPPNAIFGPVWTVLYALMGIAAWLVWRRAGLRGASVALALFVGQLVLNALWSYLFFGRQQPGVAFVEIVVMWILILVVTVLFWRHDATAGALLIPYLAWVGFASVLNFTLWRLNAGHLT
jgi:translocator protein